MYNYGAAPQYGAPAGYAPPAYGSFAPAYGAPYGAPHAASPGPYGAPPTPYGAPPIPYAAPPAPYVSPAYGAQAAPYGASSAMSGVPPLQSSTAAVTTPPATAEQQRVGTNLVASNSSQQNMQHQQPAGQPPPAQQSYPPVTAAPLPQTAHTEGNNTSSSSIQRPSSAFPSFSTSSSHVPPSGPTQVSDVQTRPTSAVPTPAASVYGTAYATPSYIYQQPTAPFTYGQHSQWPSTRPCATPAAAPPMQSYMPPTVYAPVPGHGTRRRRAVLIGCSYPGSSAALNGCLNDVQCIQFCLKKRFGFTDQEIVVLRDDAGRAPNFISTKANIYRAIQWLMMDQRYGDSLFFHFSGHGSQQYDRNGDEDDGYDETICPSDFRHAGQIVDDELNRLLVRALMPGVTLHAVIDACHSGTALDLPFRAKVDSAGRWYWKGRARYDKTTAGGTAFQFGACKDSQVAQDTKVLSGYAYTGAATFCFIQAIEKYGVDQTYGQILSHMMSALRATTGAPGINLGSTGSLIAGLLLGPAASLFTSGGQTPVLSCDKQVDLYNTKLSL